MSLPEPSGPFLMMRASSIFLFLRSSFSRRRGRRSVVHTDSEGFLRLPEPEAAKGLNQFRQDIKIKALLDVVRWIERAKRNRRVRVR